MKSHRNRKLMIVGLVALIITGIPMVAIGLNQFWARQFTPVTFHFHYSNLEGFSFTDWTEYLTKTESLTPVNNAICLTITENSVLDPLLLECSFTSTAQGAQVTAVGRYLWAREDLDGNLLVSSDPEFLIPTDGTPILLDMEKLTWGDWVTNGDGQALEIIFTVQKGSITETSSGDYTYTASVILGTE